MGTAALVQTSPALTTLPPWRSLDGKVNMSMRNSVPVFATPMDCSPPDSSGSWDFAGKNTRMGCYFLLGGSPGDLPDPGIKSASPAFAGGFFTT